MLLKTIIIPAFVAAVFMFVAPVFAESDAEQRHVRFQQVLDVMNDNGDRVLDQAELETFLKSKAEAIIAKLRKAGFLVTGQDDEAFRRFIHRQAAFIINRVGKGKPITEAQLADFENADLEYPFVGKVKDLLPPPPGSPTAAAGATEVETKPPASVLDTLQEWISIRKSYLDSKDVGRPAALSLTHFGADDATRDPDQSGTAVDVRAALSLTAPALESTHDLGTFLLTWNPVAAIEADVSTDSKKGRDKIVHRIGAEGVFFKALTTRWLSGHNFKATFDYATDHTYKSALIGGTGQYSPNFRLIGIGEYKQLGQLELGQLGKLRLFFRWRPYLGVTAADVEDDGGNDTLREMNGYVNGYVHSAGDLLIGTHLHLVPEITLFHQLINRHGTHALFSVGLRYSLDEHDRLSLEASYTRGKDSPEFVRQDQFSVGLAIKF